MAVKHTKNELKNQRDSLKRFQRYLPTLQLKKQQLQLEIRVLEQKRQTIIREDEALQKQVESWISLWENALEPADFVQLQNVELTTGNIAGFTIPILKELKIYLIEPDFENSPLWFDDALLVLKRRVELDIHRRIADVQWERLSAELRVTSQRVNLFEKVKIPETKENIRAIRIFLGDEQTAAVARAKMAKTKTAEAL